MSTDALPPLYSRLDPEMTARTRRATANAKPSTSQSMLEYMLFAVFGGTILIAAIALVITNSNGFRHAPNSIAAGIAADRVNILVMQTTHPQNGSAIETEGLMLLSVKPSTHEVAITSIPRELWVKLGRYGQRRLGAAIAVGRAAGYPGDGAGLTADTIQAAFGQTVHGYVALDRVDLVHAVDAVGGIDVNVPQSLLEYRHHDRFVKGIAHMNGETAMRYACSTHVMGPANQWYAREARQQQVLGALAMKAARSGVAQKLASLPLDDRTNLAPPNIAWLTGMLNGRALRHVTLAPYMDTFDVATFADEGEAVRPKAGDFKEVRHIVANVFAQTAIAAK